MQSLCEWWTWIIRINCQSLAEISCKFLGGSTRVVLTRLRKYTLTHVTWNISYFYLLIHLISFNNRRSLYWEIYEESLQYVQCGLTGWDMCSLCREMWGVGGWGWGWGAGSYCCYWAPCLGISPGQPGRTGGPWENNGTLAARTTLSLATTSHHNLQWGLKLAEITNQIGF